MGNNTTTSVPLSHSLVNGTVGQHDTYRDSKRDTAGTASLKTLANRVLQRNEKRDTAWDSNGMPLKNSGTVSNKPTEYVGQLYDDTYYIDIYHERIAIIQHDAGITKELAAHEAFKETLLEWMSHNQPSVVNALRATLTMQQHWVN